MRATLNIHSNRRWANQRFAFSEILGGCSPLAKSARWITVTLLLRIFATQLLWRNFDENCNILSFIILLVSTIINSFIYRRCVRPHVRRFCLNAFWNNCQLSWWIRGWKCRVRQSCTIIDQSICNFESIILVSRQYFICCHTVRIFFLSYTMCSKSLEILSWYCLVKLSQCFLLGVQASNKWTTRTTGFLETFVSLSNSPIIPHWNPSKFFMSSGKKYYLQYPFSETHPVVQIKELIVIWSSTV